MTQSHTNGRRLFNTALAGAGAATALAPFNIARAQPQKLKVGVLLPRSGVQGFIGQSCADRRRHRTRADQGDHRCRLTSS